jgi:hypothetical protein
MTLIPRREIGLISELEKSLAWQDKWDSLREKLSRRKVQLGNDTVSYSHILQIALKQHRGRVNAWSSEQQEIGNSTTVLRLHMGVVLSEASWDSYHKATWNCGFRILLVITSLAFSLQANYTATCRRISVPTFADRGVSRGERDPHGR